MRRSIYAVYRCVHLSCTLCAKRIYGLIVPALRSHRLSPVCLCVCVFSLGRVGGKSPKDTGVVASPVVPDFYRLKP